MNKKSVNMLAIIISLVFAASSLGSLHVSAATSPMLTFSKNELSLDSGETATINISVSGNDISNNAELVLTSTGIEITSITTNEDCLSLNQTASKDGATLDIAKVNSDFSQNEVIAIITVKAASAGTYTIKFSPDTKVNQKELTTTSEELKVIVDGGSSAVSTASDSSSSIPVIGIGLGIIIIAVLAIVTFFVVKKNKKKTTDSAKI